MKMVGFEVNFCYMKCFQETHRTSSGMMRAFRESDSDTEMMDAAPEARKDEDMVDDAAES